MGKEVLNLEVKSNIGEVADGVDKAAQSTKNLAEQTDRVDDATKKGATGFKGMGTAIKGVGVALKAAGIGLVVALMAKLMEVFSKNQKVVDAFDIAMESLSIAFNDLFSFLSKNVGKVTGWFKDIFENPQQSIKDFGAAIKENLLERFDSLLETFGHLGKALGHLFKGEFAEAWGSVKDAGKESIDIMTGVDDSVDKITTTITNAAGAIKDYANETINAAKATNELRRAAELAAVVNQGIIEQKDREAELQRQIRDDETKTFAERIAANEQLKVVLEEQEKLMLANAKTAVAYAQTQVAMNDNDANKIALQEALNEQDAIKAQIAGFMSEQLTNQVSLEKELGEVKKEVTNATLEGMDLELEELKNSYEMQLEMARKSGQDTTALTEKYAKDKKKIEDSAAQDDIDRAKAVEQAKQKTMSMGLDALGALAGESDTAQKAVAVAKTIYNTQQAIMNAMANVPAPFNVAQAALTGIMGAKSIQTILSTSPDSGGGGGGGGSSIPTASAQTPAPQMMSGAFELTGGQEVEPARAYVVSDDITDSQNGLAIIRRRATI